MMIDGDPYFFIYGGLDDLTGNTLFFNDVFVLDVKNDAWALLYGTPNQAGWLSVVSVTASSQGASDGYSPTNQFPSMNKFADVFQRVSFVDEFQRDLTEVYVPCGFGANDVISNSNP